MAAHRTLALGVALALLAYGFAAAQTQLEMNDAEAAKFAAADKAMNAAYQRLMAKITPAGQKSLREAQRAWLSFRDQECDFETLGSADGSVHPMVVSACKAKLTRVRTADLQTQIDCPEGDVGCGNQ
jgi:uncharacterized protein YecT (DUF1311 family)